MHKKIMGLFTVLAVLAISVTAALSAQKSNENCDSGGLHERFCLERYELHPLEEQMDALLKQAIDEYKSMWGEEATLDGRQKITEAQESWIAYRDKHCRYWYFRNAPAHSGSEQLAVTRCLLGKTKERVAEIRRDYLKD